MRAAALLVAVFTYMDGVTLGTFFGGKHIRHSGFGLVILWRATGYTSDGLFLTAYTMGKRCGEEAVGRNAGFMGFLCVLVAAWGKRRLPENRKFDFQVA